MSGGPRYSWQLLRAGPLWLDAGSMFGVIPRILWSRFVPTDDRGRIQLAHNCLLLRGPGQQLVLIETGSGDKADDKMRSIFGLADWGITQALARIDVHPEDISQVIVSHLHFDHAGGLTRRCRDGETPDHARHNVKLTFPNAPILVQRQEWEDALAGRSVMTRTYLLDHLEPLRQRLILLDSPPLFGHLPDKQEAPLFPIDRLATEVLPGIKVFSIPGHTWGQQAILFTDDKDRTIVFSADLIPTIHHVGAAYNMAYDVEPYISTVTRRWFLQLAAERDWLLVLDHEPGNPCQKVKPDGKGWYQLVPADAP
jgi:glyoxylase-like metal-dependent hydrolase (beta-lactamase superfamily II)